MRSGDALTGASGDFDHQAGLVSKFSGRRPGYHLQRLNGIERNLVRKYFALLIGDRLAVHGKRVFSVIAEPVKKSIGIGGNTWSREGHQGADRRRWTFQRQLFKERAIDVGGERGNIFLFK